MEIYDQHEQSERVRSWLKDNAGAILTGIVIGLGAIFGYHQWQNHQARQAFTAAELYERARAADPAPAPADNAQATPADAPAGADIALSELRSAYSNSGFAILAALKQADAQLDAGDLDGARATLTWVRDNGREPALLSVAGLRLARLQLAGDQADAALKTIETMPEEGFAAEKAELRGDIHAALGQAEQARAAYLDAQTAGATDASRLDMKLAEYGPAPSTGEGA